MRVLTRSQAIQELRGTLVALVDDEHSMCEVAARCGIFCKGFAQFDDAALRERYDWIVRARRPRDRAELEGLANRWQLARGFVMETDLSCDVQALEHDTCHGWDEHADEDLVRYHREIRGEDIAIESLAPVHVRPGRSDPEPVRMRPTPGRVATVAGRSRRASSHPRPVVVAPEREKVDRHANVDRRPSRIP